MNKFFSILFASMVPVTLFAQERLGDVKDFLKNFSVVVDSSKEVALGLALLFFFWGLAKFILNAGDTSEHEKGKNIMIWGIVALFVIASWAGLVRFLQSNLGIGPGSGLESDAVQFTQETA